MSQGKLGGSTGSQSTGSTGSSLDSMFAGMFGSPQTPQTNTLSGGNIGQPQQPVQQNTTPNINSMFSSILGGTGASSAASLLNQAAPAFNMPQQQSQANPLDSFTSMNNGTQQTYGNANGPTPWENVAPQQPTYGQSTYGQTQPMYQQQPTYDQSTYGQTQPMYQQQPMYAQTQARPTPQPLSMPSTASRPASSPTSMVSSMANKAMGSVMGAAGKAGMNALGGLFGGGSSSPNYSYDDSANGLYGPTPDGGNINDSFGTDYTYNDSTNGLYGPTAGGGNIDSTQYTGGQDTGSWYDTTPTNSSNFGGGFDFSTPSFDTSSFDFSTPSFDTSSFDLGSMDFGGDWGW